MGQAVWSPEKKPKTLHHVRLVKNSWCSTAGALQVDRCPLIKRSWCSAASVVEVIKRSWCSTAGVVQLVKYNASVQVQLQLMRTVPARDVQRQSTASGGQVQRQLVKYGAGSCRTAGKVQSKDVKYNWLHTQLLLGQLPAHDLAFSYTLYRNGLKGFAFGRV